MAINVVLFVITYMDYGTTRKYFYLRQVIKVGIHFTTLIFVIFVSSYHNSAR